MALVTCDKLSLGYDGNVLVNNLNFTVKSGDYLCIVGENGSGKSTLMKTLLGLKLPISGKVCFGDGLTAEKIGYLPQQTQVQKDFPASVTEVVMSGFCGRNGLKPFYSAAQKKICLQQIEKMGISHLKKKCYRELSGGQQQRVLLSRALCATEKLLVLDEPVTGLDPKAASQMYELIYSLNKKDGISVIMVSHDFSSVIKYASHILHIGQNSFFGTKEEYLKTDLGKVFTAKGGESIG